MVCTGTDSGDVTTLASDAPPTGPAAKGFIFRDREMRFAANTEMATRATPPMEAPMAMPSVLVLIPESRLGAPVDVDVTENEDEPVRISPVFVSCKAMK